MNQLTFNSNINENNILQYLDIIKELLPYATDDSIIQGFNILLSQKEQFVGVNEGEVPVGFIQYKITTNLENYTQLVLDEIVVAESHRGNGYGKLMMNHIEEIAKQAQCTMIFLATSKNNSIAQKFYYSKGYELSGLYMRKALTK